LRRLTGFDVPVLTHVRLQLHASLTFLVAELVPDGRTRGRCSADDTSGNRATMTFTVTVKRAG